MNLLARLWTSAVAYVALAIGAGLSIAGNVADTFRTRADATDTLDVVLAVAWPALVVLMVEMFVSRLWPSTKPMQAIRWIGCLAIGAMAMRVSWVHLNDLLASRGQDADVATIGPMAIDALAIMATALILSGRGAMYDKVQVSPTVQPVASPVDIDPGPAYVDSVDPLPAGPVDAPLDPWVRPDLFVPDELTVATEAEGWMASTGGQAVATVAKQRVATARRPGASYDQDAARAMIRGLLSIDKTPGEIDDALAKGFGISARTSRRLRGQVTGAPVSGPPSDFRDGQ